MVNKMKNYEVTSDLWDIANFIGKALHGIATGATFTDKDAKDTIDTICAIAKLGTDYIVDNEDKVRELRDFLNAISNAGKGSIDLLCSKSEDW
jgi:hypothetical protein